MARKGLIESNARKKEMARRFLEKRNQLKACIRKKDVPLDERFEKVLELAKLPRNGSLTRFRSRCMMTGRPRGVYRFCQLSRIAFRDEAMAGRLPGVTRSSW